MWINWMSILCTISIEFKRTDNQITTYLSPLWVLRTVLLHSFIFLFWVVLKFVQWKSFQVQPLYKSGSVCCSICPTLQWPRLIPNVTGLYSWECHLHTHSASQPGIAWLSVTVQQLFVWLTIIHSSHIFSTRGNICSVLMASLNPGALLVILLLSDTQQEPWWLLAQQYTGLCYTWVFFPFFSLKQALEKYGLYSQRQVPFRKKK